ncbi:MAG: hypothetical protein ACE5FT_02665 [Candidatus Nanoarchaeia archaeon]
MKRGQITIIIIMILVLIVIFMTLNYISKSGAKERGEQAIEVSHLQKEAIAPIKSFVTSCFEDAVIRGLKLIGVQGGYIYESQGGPSPDFNEQTQDLGGDLGEKFARFDDHNVAYAIFEPVGSVGTLLFSQAPEYPFPTFPELHSFDIEKYPSGVITHTHFGGYYGRNRLVPLNATEALSAEKQLQVYAGNQLEECLDWSLFPSNLVIATGYPQVNFTLGEREVVSTLYYQVNITDNVTGAKAQLDEFLIKVPVRLKNLFTFMNFVTDFEVTNITFSLAQARENDMKVQIVPDVFEDDYIVRLVDDQSRIQDEAYVFQFMAHNRLPALFLMNHTREEGHADSVNDFIVCASWDLSGNDLPAVIKIEDGHFIIENAAPCDEPKVLDIELMAEDPDKDDLEFMFNVADAEGVFRGTQGVRYEVKDDLIQRLERGASGGLIQTDPLLVNVSVRDEMRSDYQIMAFQVARKAAT